MENFLSQEGVFLDFTTKNEGCLLWRNQLVKDLLEPICKEFRDDFIKHIVEANRPNCFTKSVLLPLGIREIKE